MNPAYMLRQLQNESYDSSNIIGNIVSLNPICSSNSPDQWEREALLKFEKGEKEVLAFSQINDKDYYRLIEPIEIEESCLKCHASQGYKVGDIRGAISVAVPMEPMVAISRENLVINIALHISFLIAGFIGINTTRKRFSKKIIAKGKVEDKLFVKDERLKLALGATNAGVWDWNIQTREAVFDERWAEISGHTLEELAPISIETWNKLVHPDDIQELDLLLEKHYSNDTVHYEYETRMKHKNGKWIWVQISGKVIEWDYKNNPIRMVGVIIDITERKEREVVIENSNAQFSSIMNSLDAIVYVADMQTYELLFVNNSLRREIGDVSGKICWQTIQKGQTEPCEFCTNNKLLNNVGEPGNPYSWEFQNTKTGKWYLIKDKAIRWHDGRIVRLEIATDITESKKAEVALKESEERFRTTFNQAVDPIFIAQVSDNQVPTIYDINQTVTKVLGYTRKELIGKPMNFVHVNEEKDNIFKRVKSLLGGNQVFFETVAKKKNSTLIPIEMSAKRIKIGNKYFLYIVERDISERKKWEKEILESQKRLEEENSNKDKFFSIISHDLKAPFGALLGITQFLQDSYDEMSEQERKEMIHVAKNSANNIFELLDGLLEWSRAKSGRMEFAPSIVNLHESSLHVIQILIQNAKNKNIDISNYIEEGISVFADEKMLRTILRNLLANAIKFTPKDGKIIIESKITEEQIEISVSDNGIGMNEKDISKLFKIEVHHTTLGTENESGTGVGLILCQELVENNGGIIWAESELGKGSVFKFTLPIKK